MIAVERLQLGKDHAGDNIAVIDQRRRGGVAERERRQPRDHFLERIVIGGVVLGAIGVSGAASAQQDQEIAKAAADAFAMRLGALPANR